MAQAVVSFILEKLGELVIDGVIAEAKFLREVKEKVEDAKQELRRIRCFLKDADARVRNGDETLALLVEEINDAAYDLDDVVSTFVLTEEAEAEAAATKGVVDKVVDGLLLKRPIKFHNVGVEVDKILNRLSELKQSLERHGVWRDNNVGDSSSRKDFNQRLNDLRRTYSHVLEHDFVENEGGMMELVTQLTKKGKSGSPFLSIHGMGGLGKTTLAKMVYRHKDVTKHFKRFAWVFVSQQFQPKDIWKGVLLDLVSDPREKEEIREMEDDELAKKLYDVLTKQKCLVVLDDVWQKADWDSLAKPAVPEKRTSSKILITTRRRDVAEHACRRGFLYQPPHLNFTASWELLKKKAYFQEDATSRSDYEDMEKLGKDMVKYCGGLPLAIVVLGGLLSTKHTAVEWEAVKQNVKELINKGQSIDEQEYNTVFAVLGLSYDELPNLLKPCFLHLANFPEDYEINVKELCRLWTAEGFVPVEDEAHKCLMALVDRGMVQAGRLSSIVVGRIKTCRIHDLMVDVCLEKAKKENFFHRINFQVPGDSLPTSNVRRLALAVQLNDDIVVGLSRLTNIRDRRMRSLLCSAPNLGDLNGLMKPLLNRFNMLRVFKLELSSRDLFSGGLQIPEEIGNLIHLRVVSFKGFGLLLPLPPSMVNLRCLQTLDLRIISYPYQIMDSIFLQSMNVLSKFDHLRHLYLPKFFSLPENGLRLQLGNLRSLETLVNFDTGYCGLDDWSQLTKLTRLSITTRQDLEAINPASNLQSLSVKAVNLNWKDNRFLSSYPQIQKLKLRAMVLNSLENRFFPNPVKLTLEFTFLTVDTMPILGKLSKLRILALSNNDYNGKIMVCCKDSFPQLESLSLDNLWGLEEWRVEEGALSKLCRLEIYGCEDLKSYPDGLGNITTLKEIKLREMGEDFMRSLDQKGGDEDSTRRSSKSD
ncbi:hypothetical protein UlMin_030522 [Ulmus minor]